MPKLRSHHCLRVYNLDHFPKLYNSFTYMQRGLYSSNTKNDKAEQKHDVLYELIHQKFLKIKTALERHDGNDIIQRMLNYLEDVSGMTEVRKSRALVDKLNQDIRNVVMEKRKVIRKLDKSFKESTLIYKQMRTSSNKEYQALLRKEIKLAEYGQLLHDQMNSYDDCEQELFSKLLLAINETYDKERMHTNFIRILGFISIIISSILTLLLSHQRNQFIHFRKEIERSAVVEDPSPKESWGSYLKRNTKWMHGWYTK